jgi:carbohydrate kinase (thermoresistant glucokinase family)
MDKSEKKWNLVVMGVSGCGKTTLAKALAQSLDLNFMEGDDFHPQANVDKMSSGVPLNDEDRKPWLEKINEEIQKQSGVVVSCSALKEVYREILSRDIDELIFIHLDGSFDLIYNRMQQRSNHFMPVELLKSQFDTLENPKNAIVINIDQSMEDILKEAIEKLKMNQPRSY